MRQAGNFDCIQSQGFVVSTVHAVSVNLQDGRVHSTGVVSEIFHRILTIGLLRILLFVCRNGWYDHFSVLVWLLARCLRAFAPMSTILIRSSPVVLEVPRLPAFWSGELSSVHAQVS